MSQASTAIIIPAAFIGVAIFVIGITIGIFLEKRIQARRRARLRTSGKRGNIESLPSSRTENNSLLSSTKATPVRVPSGIKTSPNRVSMRQNSMKSDTHENGGEKMPSDKGNGVPKDNTGRPRPTMGVRSIENKRDSMLNAQGS